MIRLLVFLMLLFGLFGVISSQYIVQYREAYALWINSIVYGGNEEKPTCKEKREICSKLESYSREICELANMLLLIFILLCITFLIVIYTIQENILLLNSNSTSDLNIFYGLRFLVFILFVSLFLIFYLLKINLIYSTSKTSAIDEKIFSVWYELKCHDCKKNPYHDKLEPSRLYETYAEKIDSGEINSSQEERDLLKKLLRKKMNLA
ncbi:Uncharacterised protein [uncultured archaeon]|nr:Uncharacterised protein [uncultured archaeon]